MRMNYNPSGILVLFTFISWEGFWKRSKSIQCFIYFQDKQLDFFFREELSYV